MKITLTLIILTFTFCRCKQESNHDKMNIYNLSDRTNRKDLLENDTNSLTIYKTHYALSLQGQRQEIKTKEELLETLKKNYNRKDSLYVFIDETSGNRIEDVITTIHKSKIEKYKVIAKNEFFKLPYPNKK